MITLKESTKVFIEEKGDYYKNWTLDTPLIINKSTYNDVQKLQKILYKLIQQFVNNYNEYAHLMPLSKDSEAIIELFNQKPYKVGTYRTDFVYTDKGQIKLIEITCRFALNGIFQTSIFDEIGKKYCLDHLKQNSIHPYNDIYKHIESYIKDHKRVYILKGSDQKNESKIYSEILERMGIKVESVNYLNIEKHLYEMKDSWIISELALSEIESLDFSTLKTLSQLDISNDFRTVFLLHDKRFFSVIGNKQLQQSILTEDEITHFMKYYIPTFTFSENQEKWDNAKTHKNNWIIKHRSLGKSQCIYAGPVTEQSEWENLFTNKLEDMVLQEWIPQTTTSIPYKGDLIEEYITGTLLFYDNHFFGFGEFRTSSFPVTNKVDHRKMAPLILEQ